VAAVVDRHTREVVGERQELRVQAISDRVRADRQGGYGEPVLLDRGGTSSAWPAIAL